MAIRLAAAESCGFCDCLNGLKQCAFIRRGPLVSSLINRTQYETGALLVITNHHLATVLDVPQETLHAAAIEAQLLGRVLVDHFGATGLNLFQNNGIDANQHYPHYHLHLVPRYPGSDSTRIYQERDFTPILLSEQQEIAARLRQALPRAQ